MSKGPKISLGEALRQASREVAESPEWLKRIEAQNDAIAREQARRLKGNIVEENMPTNREELLAAAQVARDNPCPDTFLILMIRAMRNAGAECGLDAKGLREVAEEVFSEPPLLGRECERMFSRWMDLRDEMAEGVARFFDGRTVVQNQGIRIPPEQAEDFRIMSSDRLDALEDLLQGCKSLVNDTHSYISTGVLPRKWK